MLKCDPSAQKQSQIAFLAFEYDAPFERERNPLYNNIKFILLSQS